MLRRPSHPGACATAAVVWLTLLAPAIATAQTTSTSEGGTRQSLLDDARQQLESESTPPTRSRTERFLLWYDEQDILGRVFSGEIGSGFHLASGGFPAGAGMTAAVGFDRTFPRHGDDSLEPNRVHVSGLGAYSRRGYKRASGGLSVHDVGGSRLDIDAFGQYYEYPEEDFFGFGIDSIEDARSNYLLEAVEAGGAVHWRPSKFTFSAGAAFWRPETASGEDTRYPSVEQVFDPTQVAGLGTETDFLKVEATIAYDWRDNSLFPKAGGRYIASATQYNDRDLGRFDSHRIGVSLQQIVPLPNRYRRLALRAEAAFTGADSDQTVPFYLQPTLGGARNLRGFREFRFRDRNAVLVGAEYQWEAWWALDVAFFADAGTVAYNRSQLTLNSMEAAYGVGFRFHSNRALVGRLDLAFSREGFIPLLRFDHVF
jgi:hypothetical protein